MFGPLVIVFGLFFMKFCLILGQFKEDKDSSSKRESILAKREWIESYRQKKTIISSSPASSNASASGKEYD